MISQIFSGTLISWEFTAHIYSVKFLESDDTMPSISGSVGSGALNRPSDVLTVQKLLNRKNSKLGGLKPLVEDGISGPNTINAIKAFQANVVKLGSPDGRIDTNGQTIVYLNQANYDDTPTPAPPANNPIPPSVPAPSEDGEMRYPDRTVTMVVSDEFEPVSTRTVRLSLIPRRDRATRQEQRHGSA